MATSQRGPTGRPRCVSTDGDWSERRCSRRSAALTARLSTTARHRCGYGCDLSLTAWNGDVPAADRASPGVSQAEIVTRPGWTESKQTQPGTSGPEERQIGRRAAALPQQHICGLGARRDTIGTSGDRRRVCRGPPDLQGTARPAGDSQTCGGQPDLQGTTRPAGDRQTCRGLMGLSDDWQVSKGPSGLQGTEGLHWVREDGV